MLTLWGMMQYDSTIMGGLDLPDGIDSDLLVDLIVDECGELYPYYQVPYAVKNHVHNFFSRNKYRFQKMLDALNTEYKPLENYNRTETETENTTETPDILKTRTPNITSTSTSNVSDTTENNVSAYNVSSYSPSSQVVGETRTAASATETGTETESETGQRETARGRKVNAYGNIGVTTSQQMLESELEVRKFDIYQYIVKCFMKEIILRVY